MTGAAVNLTRRQFGKAAGALVVAFTLAPRLAGAQAPKLPGSLANNPMLDAWLRINADGSATIFTGKVELGQGITTALAQTAAEELDLPFPRVNMISGDTAQTPEENYTPRSQSIEYGGTAIRPACAAAPPLLSPPPPTSPAPRRAPQQKKRRHPPPPPPQTKLDPPPPPPSSPPHTPTPAKPPPNKKTSPPPPPPPPTPPKRRAAPPPITTPPPPPGCTNRPAPPPPLPPPPPTPPPPPPRGTPPLLPSWGRGVSPPPPGGGGQAREALIGAAKWGGGSELPDPTRLLEQLMALPTQSSVVSEKQAAASPVEQTLEATYTRPYIAHASIGPSCAIAEFTDGKLTVWTHSQGVFPLKRDLAKALKLDAGAVRCVHAEGSGCYGHNGADDVALDAALLARAVPGRPVRLQWMRDDEFAWEPYGPAMLARAKASLDANGKIVDWVYEVWSNTHSTRPAAPDGDNNLLASWYVAEPSRPGPPSNIPQPAGGGDRNAVPLYDFPNQRVVNHLITGMPLRVSALRTLGAYANVFAVESFMDELAVAAGQDPVAFRLAHISDQRARAVINAVTRRAAWKAGMKGDGVRGRGVAFAKYKNLATYVAVVAEVEIDRKTGRVRVPRAFAAADAGQNINPDGLANQIEGGMIQSTSWSLHEAVRFDRIGITSRDWSGYPILTMPDVPEIVVTLLDRNVEKPLGAGEASQGPMAAAIANAFANATGCRLRDLPFTPARVQTALG